MIKDAYAIHVSCEDKGNSVTVKLLAVCETKELAIEYIEDYVLAYSKSENVGNVFKSLNDERYRFEVYSNLFGFMKHEVYIDKVKWIKKD